ncbi:MAG: radical SAM family heme chaperone HemW [Streptococcaceae bacterium]|jgi:oxygen-independent coproporphyrinogen-3 oxidase|nr:radical SAM family heme chaperone HemW [Streptococcaceae bacterium]
MKKPEAAYVHIPFCSQICYYCDFAKVVVAGQPVDAYLEALIDEWRGYTISNLKTLYIGGGTPTVLSPQQMKKLLSALTEVLSDTADMEITVEANPGDLSDEMISALADSPVNRVSVGVQTFDNRLLKKIGRNQTADEALSALTRLRAAGFENLTVDLIYGLPGQTLDDVIRDVAQFLALDLPHIALYGLILEDHTRFMQLERMGKLNLPTDDRAADMYEYIVSQLTAAGYGHYEISNFSKPGFESKHNLTYWDNAEYYGVGAGASGYVNGVRYKNHGPIQHYINSVDKRVTADTLTEHQKMEEELFLGLRKATGVSVATFDAKFSQSFSAVYGDVVDKLAKTDLVSYDGQILRLTERGFELGNEVFAEFLLDT